MSRIQVEARDQEHGVDVGSHDLWFGRVAGRFAVERAAPFEDTMNHGTPAVEGFQHDPVPDRGIAGQAFRVVPESPGDFGKRISSFTCGEGPVTVLDDHAGGDEAFDTIGLEERCEIIIPSKFNEARHVCRVGSIIADHSPVNTARNQ